MRVKKGDNVRVRYQGRLTDGTTFDPARLAAANKLYYRRWNGHSGI